MLLRGGMKNASDRISRQFSQFGNVACEIGIIKKSGKSATVGIGEAVKVLRLERLFGSFR